MPDLLTETTKRINKLPRHISLTDVANDTGLTLSWLSDFARGKIKDPGIRKVQILYEYLSVDRPFNKTRVDYADIVNTIPTKQSNKAFYVYFIFAGKQCLYVGFTRNLRTRMLSHVKNKEYIEAGFTHVILSPFYLTDYANKTDAEKVAREFEKDRIKHLLPTFNVRYNCAK